MRINSYSIGFGDPGSGIGESDMPLFVASVIFGISIPAIVMIVLSEDEFFLELR